MKVLEWSWRYRRATQPRPRYLQEIHVTGPARFDATLQMAGEMMRARQTTGGPVLNGGLRSTSLTVVSATAPTGGRQQAA
jgi:hypothetical protein